MYKKLYTDVSQPVGELASLVYHHFGKAPMGWTGIDKLTEYAHNEQFVEKVLFLYDNLSNRRDLFYGINPSQYYKIIYKFQLASKSLPYATEKLTDCYLFLANYAIRVYNCNLEQIENFVKTDPFTKAVDKRAVTDVVYLSALLRSFSETLYCDEHTIAGEIYSPIECGDDVVIARKYSLLNAVELRGELSNCKYAKINIYTKYKGLRQRAVTDIVGNLLINENIAPYMCGYYAETTLTDGSTCRIDEPENLREACEYFEKKIPCLVNAYKNMTEEDRLWKKIVCEFYALKPFCDEIGQDWQPYSYQLDIKKIADISRPIVRANEEIALLSGEKEIKQKLFTLNDPRVHW
ncbi:MAG: hypothetical protein ACI4MQ_01820 [Candidatus Coproplasma sp.]